jgi:hypothetical protein
MTTCTPVENAMDALTRILAASRTQSAQRPGILEMLTDADTAMAELARALDRLDDFGILCPGDDLAKRTREARALWAGLPAGDRIDNMAPLVAASPTLSAMSRAAVTFTGGTRFSQKHIEISRRVGSELSDFPQYVSQLAGTSRVSDDGTFLVAAGAVDKLERTLAWMNAQKLIEGFRIEFTHGTGAAAKWLPKAKGRTPAHSRAWRVVRGTVAAEYRSLLAGDWLTAYAAWIAADQFERLGVAYELFTKLEYELPADLGGGRSDIDVLVRTDDILVCIECKSGNLTASSGKGPSAIEKTVADAARLEKVFSRLGLELERRFPLVHTGRTADAAQHLDAGELPVFLLTPSEIRAAVETLGRVA